MISLYGIFISFGIYFSILSVQKLIDRNDRDILWGLSFWAIISGVIGARIYHVVDYFEYYYSYPSEILKMWNGGLGIWGALFGGLIGICLYLKIKKKKILPWLDVAAVSVPLGQAIGRWGNFFNNELFGTPTSLPWGIYVKPENRPEQHRNLEKFHPLFFYESILNLILFSILFRFYKKHNRKIPSGIFLSMYLGGYALIRFFLEYLRLDPWEITLKNGCFLNVSQCISILVLTFSIVFASLRIKK